LSFAAEADNKSDKAKYQEGIEQIKKENPTDYEKLKLLYNFQAELLLTSLGYGIDPIDGILDDKLKNALKIYEKKRNIPVTGDPLSYETMNQIDADRTTMDFDPVLLPSLSVYTDTWDKGYLIAKGTWVLSNDQMLWPEQTTQIECNRDKNSCTEVTASISRFGGSPSLVLELNSYEIERWDNYEIVTKPVETALGCVRYIRRINRLQKSVTGIRSTISKESFCSEVESKELYMTLNNGIDVYIDLSQKQDKKENELLNVSPELLKTLQSQ